jgi:hypothetical protein
MMDLNSRKRLYPEPSEEQKYDNTPGTPADGLDMGQDPVSDTSPFISNLYRALNDQRFPHIISWSDNGIKFTIHSMEAYKNEVMPIYFPTTKHSTFIRQVSEFPPNRDSKLALYS